MSAHVYVTEDTDKRMWWRARCYDHEPVWSGPDREDTDAGLNKAFNDGKRHNRVEHNDV